MVAPAVISAEVKALRERWRTPEGRALGIEVGRWLAGKGRRPPRSVGTFEGKIDLRGFAFPDARQVGEFKVGRTTFKSIEGFPEFNSVRWRGIDFTGAVIRSARFFTSTIDNCRFDQADLFDWRLWATRVSDSSFTKADLQSGAIGTGHYGKAGTNVWTRVNFDRADMRGAGLRQCVLRDCTFRKTNLRKVWFSYVTFDGVAFEGLLDGVLFEGRHHADSGNPPPMRNVDFRGVRFRDCDFRHRFDNVMFDESPDVRVIRDFPAVVRQAAECARENGDAEEKEMASVLEAVVGRDLPATYDSIFFPGDFIRGGMTESAAAFGRLLDCAEAKLATSAGRQ